MIHVGEIYEDRHLSRHSVEKVGDERVHGIQVTGPGAGIRWWGRREDWETAIERGDLRLVFSMTQECPPYVEQVARTLAENAPPEAEPPEMSPEQWQSYHAEPRPLDPYRARLAPPRRSHQEPEKTEP